MKKISFTNSKYYKIYTPLLPFKLGGKWYLWKKIRTTYLINPDGDSVPIKTELVENIKEIDFSLITKENEFKSIEDNIEEIHKRFQFEDDKTQMNEMIKLINK